MIIMMPDHGRENNEDDAACLLFGHMPEPLTLGTQTAAGVIFKLVIRCERCKRFIA
jgi:hypothetical protein